MVKIGLFMLWIVSGVAIGVLLLCTVLLCITFNQSALRWILNKVLDSCRTVEKEVELFKEEEGIECDDSSDDERVNVKQEDF